MILISGVVIITVVVLLTRGNTNEDSNYRRTPGWHVEMWHISAGYRIDLNFVNTYTIGRLNLSSQTAGNWPGQIDTSISREHCLLYEQNGVLLAWNMSAINPAAINGYRINQPEQIVPGDRLELGNSVFLITRVERV